MADIFEIVGRVSLDGLNEAEKNLKNFSDTGEQSASKLSKLGGIAKTVGAGILVGAGAVTAGAVGLVKSVSSSYGQLQQSIGGIETLFGESAQKVIDNANNAYTTAGISANEYMQQVTSFSASLLQAVGGDTEKACNTADMAIRDMADNANKMGTSMEAIQNAYQGFAKQNYTMLDNLKLGYGGTKSEMERLLEDAEKISGIKYDISNLNDVYSAIHVVQQELGITGTTALEAGETIEGSFNSLSASWENFLAGLGNPDADMAQIVDNLAKGLTGAINNVIPVINNMVNVLPTVMDAIIGAINDLAPTFIETFTSLITQVINAVVKLLPTLIPMVVDTLKNLISTLVSNLPLIINAVILLVNEVLSALSEMLPQLIPTVIQAVIDVANSLLENLPLLLNSVLQLLLGIADGLSQAFPVLISALPVLIDGILQFLVSAVPQILSVAIQLFMALIDALPTVLTSLLTALPMLVEGIVTFLVSAIPMLIDASIQLLMALIDAIPVITQVMWEVLPSVIVSIVNILYQNRGVLWQALIDICVGLWEALCNLIDSLIQSLPIIFENIKEMMNNLGSWLSGIWNSLISNIVNFFSNIGNQASSGSKSFVDKIIEFISNLPYNIGVWLGTTLSNIITWAINFVANAREAGQNFVTNLVSFLITLPGKIATFLTSAISNVYKFATSMRTKALEIGIKFVTTLLTEIKRLPGKLLNIGQDIVEGIWNGINNAGSWLKEKIEGFASGIVEGFKDSFKINSPSKVMYPIGQGIDEGVGVSLENSEASETAIKSKFGNIMNTAGTAFGKVQSFISNKVHTLGNIDTSVPEFEFAVNSKVRNEVVENPVQKYQVAFDDQFSNLNDGFDRLIGLINDYLPNIADSMSREIVLDSGAMAVGISRKVDRELGRISVSKERGNV